jgi:multidrug efflux system membrane fusion protein
MTRIFIGVLLAFWLPPLSAEAHRECSPMHCVELGLLVSGEVEEVLVGRGQRVEKGQLLLKLEPSLFHARVNEAEARLRAAEAGLRQAERELERARELYERTLLSDYELQEAEVAHLQAKSRRAEAQRRLLAARKDLERSRLRAPFPGQVKRVFAYPGQALQNSQRVQPLLELIREETGSRPTRP